MAAIGFVLFMASWILLQLNHGPATPPPTSLVLVNFVGLTMMVLSIAQWLWVVLP